MFVTGYPKAGDAKIQECKQTLEIYYSDLLYEGRRLRERVEKMLEVTEGGCVLVDDKDGFEIAMRLNDSPN